MVVTMSGFVTTRKLSAEDTARLFVDAAGARAPVALYDQDEHDRAILSGVLTGTAQSHLELMVDDVDRPSIAPCPSDALEAELVHGNLCYRFATRCVESDVETKTGVIRVLRPAKIVIVERRRSRRRRLQERADITLRDPDDPEAWSCSATMVNLSMGGMACRVRTPDAESIVGGRTLLAVFRAGAPPENINITSRVVTTTPAGTPEHLVVGMEFVADEHLDAARDRLKGALRNAASTGGQDGGS